MQVSAGPGARRYARNRRRRQVDGRQVVGQRTLWHVNHSTVGTHGSGVIGRRHATPGRRVQRRRGLWRGCRRHRYVLLGGGGAARRTGAVGTHSRFEIHWDGQRATGRGGGVRTIRSVERGRTHGRGRRAARRRGIDRVAACSTCRLAALKGAARTAGPSAVGGNRRRRRRGAIGGCHGTLGGGCGQPHHGLLPRRGVRAVDLG